MIFAHVGHWAVQLLYAVPVLFVAAAIIWSKIQEKREEAAEQEALQEAEAEDVP